RAIAAETPTPMPLLVVCRTIITQGNASEAPASALVPMRPRKNPSNVITPANASRLRMVGAARRSSEAAPDIVCAEPTGKASFLNQALEKFMQGRVSEVGTARRA